jgi:hypothetical protein
MMVKTDKNIKNRSSVTAYVDEKTYDRWWEHYNKNRPLYQSMSHMIEVNMEYGIKADNMRINKDFGKIGPHKL